MTTFVFWYLLGFVVNYYLVKTFSYILDDKDKWEWEEIKWTLKFSLLSYIALIITIGCLLYKLITDYIKNNKPPKFL